MLQVLDELLELSVRAHQERLDIVVLQFSQDRNGYLKGTTELLQLSVEECRQVAQAVFRERFSVGGGVRIDVPAER